MNENVRYVRLGAFVLVALGILLAAVAVLGGHAWFQQGEQFETYFNESVQGLDVGSPVKYRGVQVGRITEIGFVINHYPLPPEDRDRFAGTVLVRMELEPQKLLPPGNVSLYDELQRRIQTGLRVRITSMGIAGPSYLEADYLTAPPPMELVWAPQSLYIPSGPSTSTQVVSAVERLASQLENVRIDVLMADLNRLVVNVDTMVQQADIPTVSKDVTDLVSELRQTNSGLQSLLEDVRTLAGSAQSLVGDAQAVLTDPNVEKTLAESAELVASLRVSADRLNVLLSSSRIEQILDGLSEASRQAGPTATDLRQAVETLQRAVQSTGRDVGRITADLRDVVMTLDSFVQETRNNPSRLFFSQPPPRSTPGKGR